MLPCNANKNSQGFTLIETLTIVVIIGILSAISVPSFLGLLNRNKVNDAISKVQGALQEAQREAIRRGTSCPVTLNTSILNTTNKTITSPCLITGARDLCDKRDNSDNCIKSTVAVATNLSGTPPITFHLRGNTNNMGTIVLYTINGSNQQMKCLTISNPIGIMRTGNYNGSIASVSANNCETLQ